MSWPDPRTLAVQSVKDPASAAAVLMSVELPRQVLWSALVLMAALQSVLFTVSVMLAPVAPPPIPTMAILYGSPLGFFALTVVLQVMTAYAIFGIGRLFGGSGSLEQVMTVIVWFQALQVAAKAAALLLGIALPLLEVLLVFAATIIGIYMFLHFINQVHGFKSLARALGVLFAASLAVVLALSLLLTLIVAPYLGDTGYV